MNTIKNNEYYNMTEIFDNLYKQSLENKKFNNLMNLITSENNIKLAFRNIKTNTGSNTSGTDGLTIKDIKEKDIDIYIKQVREKLKNFKPDTIKRVNIKKDNGKIRPLGIPTIIDRLIQQSIKQIIEPICEAKFYKHSYGFRPNRNPHHAIARVNHLINHNGLVYTVDIDIKSFFDNINHNKLIKQMYTLGIQDRKLLAIIKEMLKAPIINEGIPSKGTPQGGILSPLLANIVLNELDWWIASQWENFPTKHNYKQNDYKIRAMKSSPKCNLKEIYIVRYADDFKIFCRDYYTAMKTNIAVRKWLQIRLKLEVNEEKSKIINLNKNYTEFLGIRIKAIKSPNSKMGITARSYITKKAKISIKNNIKKYIKIIEKDPSPLNIMKLNSIILGIQNYYNVATCVSIDLPKIAQGLYKSMHSRFGNIAQYEVPKYKSPCYERFYGHSKCKTWIIKNIAIYPLHYVKNKPPMNFNQKICKYTEEGRKILNMNRHNEIDYIIKTLSQNYIPNRSIEYNDNRISRASMTRMKCEITLTQLDINTIHCHHVISIKHGGDDSYDNLRIIHKDIHKLIHATSEECINKYKVLIKNNKMLNKLNVLRKELNLNPIIIKFK